MDEFVGTTVVIPNRQQSLWLQGLRALGRTAFYGGSSDHPPRPYVVGSESGGVVGVQQGGVIGAETGGVVGVEHGGIVGAQYGAVTGVQRGGVVGAEKGAMVGVQKGGVIGAERGAVTGVQKGGVIGAESGAFTGVQPGGVIGVEKGAINVYTHVSTDPLISMAGILLAALALLIASGISFESINPWAVVAIVAMLTCRDQIFNFCHQLVIVITNHLIYENGIND